MPVVRAMKKFVEVPSTWEAWAMRVLTIGIVLVLTAAWLLIGQIQDLQGQITSGRSERNSYQIEQTARVCAMLHAQKLDPAALKEAKC